MLLLFPLKKKLLLFHLFYEDFDQLYLYLMKFLDSAFDFLS